MPAAREFLLNPLESYLALSEPKRTWVFVIAGVLILLIAFCDWRIEEVSLGYLYVLPILLVAATLRGWHIILLAVLCGMLCEWFATWHSTPGVAARVLIGTGGFALAGYFVSRLNRQRQSIARHLRERERQVQLRLDAERQLQALIDTSPLGILTVGAEGRVLRANASAQQLLHAETPLEGQQIRAYLPIVERFLTVQPSRPKLRTAVETRGQRADGEVFLAHLWLSTFVSGSGPCLAGFISDDSENLRDREGTGLDSMMATSRILIGAISHEIRNLAAAARAAHKELEAGYTGSQAERFRTLGSVIEALENIATSGLRMASHSSTAVANLGVVLEEVRILLDPIFREYGGAVHWTIPDTLPLVEADHHSLLQVFLNLARNSETAVRDSATKMLWVEATANDHMVQVRFRDSGPGVANPESLFTPFQPRAAATGLGLYISRAVLKSYGGDLYYEPGAAGSCFVVSLWPAAGHDDKAESSS